MREHSPLKTPDEILRFAQEKEMQARDFYKDMARKCSVDFVRDLLIKLQNEEHKHVHMIQSMIERLESDKPLV